MAMVLGKRFCFVKRVAKMGKVYVITVPKEVGEMLHGKLVQVTLDEIIEEVNG